MYQFFSHGISRFIISTFCLSRLCWVLIKIHYGTMFVVCIFYDFFLFLSFFRNFISWTSIEMNKQSNFIHIFLFKYKKNVHCSFFFSFQMVSHQFSILLQRYWIGFFSCWPSLACKRFSYEANKTNAERFSRFIMIFFLLFCCYYYGWFVVGKIK